MAKSKKSIVRFRGNILRFTTRDFQQFSYSTTVVSYYTIFLYDLSKIILRLYDSSDSTIFP